MIITIDGPAGTGKTTVAKRVAEALQFPYFDTGAMYRAVTWMLLEEHVPLSDLEKVGEFLTRFQFSIQLQKGEKRYFVGSRDVTSEIRTMKITAHVSEVSAMKIVRESIWRIQRDFAAHGNAVFEGRDLGTVVFPDAAIKIFLTAAPEVRAERRLAEFTQKYPHEAANLDHDKMLKDMMRRDEYDSTREVAPLKCPEDAYVIDTSHLTIDQVVDEIIHYKQKKFSSKRAACFTSRKMHPLYRFILFLAWLFFKIFHRHKVYGLDHFYEGGAILAANHTSFLDPPIVSISWPEEVHFLARESLFKNPLFGSLIRALNTHPVSGDAGDVGVFKTTIQLLKEGKKVILFPEGTRAFRDELSPFKPGFAILLSRSNAAVIPTYIHGAFQVWNRSRKSPKLFGKTACVFGTPILYESFAHLDKKEAQKALTDHLHQSISNLRTWYEQGAQGVPP